MNLKEFTTYFQSLQAELNRSREFEPGDLRIKQNIANADLAGIAYYITHTISENTDWLGNYLSCNVANCTEVIHNLHLDMTRLLCGTDTATSEEPFKQKGLLLGLDQIYKLLKVHFEQCEGDSTLRFSPQSLQPHELALAENSQAPAQNANKIIAEIQAIAKRMLNEITACMPGDPDFSGLENTLEECQIREDQIIELLENIKTHLSQVSMPASTDSTADSEATQALPDNRIAELLETIQSLMPIAGQNNLATIEAQLSNIEDHLPALRSAPAPTSAPQPQASTLPPTEDIALQIGEPAQLASLTNDLASVAHHAANLSDNTLNIATTTASLSETTYNIAANIIALSTNSALNTHSVQNIESGLQELTKTTAQIAENTKNLSNAPNAPADTDSLASSIDTLSTHIEDCTDSVQNIEESIQALAETGTQIAETAQKLDTQSIHEDNKEILASLNDLLSHTAVCTLSVQRIENSMKAFTSSLPQSAQTPQASHTGDNAPALQTDNSELTLLTKTIAANTEKMSEHTVQIAESVQKLSENNAMLSQNINALSQKCDRMIRILELLVVATNQNARAGEKSRLQTAVSDMHKDS